MNPIDLEITDLTLDGRGVAHARGKTVFVRDALPGEVVRAEIVMHHATADDAEAKQRLHESRDRRTPRCIHFGHCGGCTLQMLDVERQVELKHRTVLEVLRRIGSVKPDRVLSPALAGSWFYRRRARFHPCQAAPGVAFGFHGIRGSRVVPILECPVLVDPHKDLPGKLARVFGSLAVSHRIRWVELLCGDEDSTLAVHLKGQATPSQQAELVKAGQALGMSLTCVQPGSGSLLASAPDSGGLTYRIDEFSLTLEFQVTDFIQVNQELNLKLVHDVVNWLGIARSDRILDLYAGIGNFSLPIARFADSVTAVEGRPSSIRTLEKNMERNGIDNVVTEVSDLNDPRAGSWDRAGCDAVVIDPPRAGASGLLERLAALNPSRMLYVSCHPATLARDARILVHKLGYALSQVKVYDMFPQTEHVETLALFVRP